MSAKVTIAGMKVRKFANYEAGGRRVKRYDPETGLARLVNPDTPGEEHEPWPLLGVRFVGDPPAEARVPTKWVDKGVAEGWIVGVNGRPVVRPAGPTQDVWNSSQTGRPHLLVHYDELVFRTLDGDVRYTVTHQPDKYVAGGGDEDAVTPDVYAAGTTRVDHFYDLRKVG